VLLAAAALARLFATLAATLASIVALASLASFPRAQRGLSDVRPLGPLRCRPSAAGLAFGARAAGRCRLRAGRVPGGGRLRCLAIQWARRRLLARRRRWRQGRRGGARLTEQGGKRTFLVGGFRRRHTAACALAQIGMARGVASDTTLDTSYLLKWNDPTIAPPISLLMHVFAICGRCRGREKPLFAKDLARCRGRARRRRVARPAGVRQELPGGRALCAWMNGAWMNGLWRPQPESPVRCPEGRADTAVAAMIAYMKVADKGLKPACRP
jgi:hypothetical protein